MIPPRFQQLFVQLLRLWRPALSLGVVLITMTGCIEWAQPMQSSELTVARYIAAVQDVAGTANAVLVKGAAPAAGSGPVVTAPIPSLILLGGTIQVQASSATPFTKVAVAVPDVDDHWELTLPAAVTSVQILIVFSQDIPKNTFTMNLGGATGSSFGLIQSNVVNVISVGTGDVQVNITWNSPADLDLHVVDPSGAEIYWANKTSVTGGNLDLDSNAGCGTDGPRAENVFWSSGLIAPRGQYIVRVDNWSNCGAVSTNYVVTVNERGKAPQVFSGVFSDGGDRGNRGSGRNISIFQY